MAHDVNPFEMAVACEVFGLDRREIADPWYRFLVVAGETPPLRTRGGFTIDTPHRLADLDEADTIILPVWRDAREVPPDDMLDAIRRAHARGARLLSFCSGAFLLAYAGVLDGLRAATHWLYADTLAEIFPAVKVDAEVLYHDEGTVLTSAGTAAAIDLCLHVVRLDHGADAANAVARRMVVPPHRHGGQAQFVQAPVKSDVDEQSLAETLDWAVAHLGEPLTVTDLARHAAMSPRSFARHFRAATGTTPLQWLSRQRVLMAQRLLETSAMPVERIAEECGFGSAANFRNRFHQMIRLSPLAYRRTFNRAACDERECDGRPERATERSSLNRT